MADRQITVTEVRKPIPVRLIVIVVALLLLALFIWRNDNEVKIEFVLFDVTTRVAWAIVISALLGFVVGLFLPRFRR